MEFSKDIFNNFNNELEKDIIEINGKYKILKSRLNKLPLEPVLVSKYTQILQCDISFLKLSAKSYYSLKKNEISTIQQLISKDIFTINSIKNLNNKDVGEIIKKLDTYGLKLLNYCSLDDNIKNIFEYSSQNYGCNLYGYSDNHEIIRNYETLIDESCFDELRINEVYKSFSLESVGFSPEIIHMLWRHNVDRIGDLSCHIWYEIIKDNVFTDEAIIQLKHEIEEFEYGFIVKKDKDVVINYIIFSIKSYRYSLKLVKRLFSILDINSIYMQEPLYLYIIDEIKEDKTIAKEMTEYLLEIGADIKLFGNKCENNLLIMFSIPCNSTFNIDACKMLLEHGADPNVITDIDCLVDSYNSTIYDQLSDAEYRHSRELDICEYAAMCDNENVYMPYLDDNTPSINDIKEMRELFEKYGYKSIIDIKRL